MVLPAPDGPTSATSWPGSMVGAHAVEHQRAVVERASSDRTGPTASRLATIDSSGYGTTRRRARCAPGGDEVDGAGAVLDRVGGVEHLEDPLEGHERRHHVDPRVGERGERAVDPGRRTRPGPRACRRTALGDHELTAEPVDGRRCQRADQAEGDEERAAVHRRADADVAHPVGRGPRTRGSRRRGGRTASPAGRPPR